MKLNGQPEITFDRQEGRLHFYLNKEKLSVGDFIVIEGYGFKELSTNSTTTTTNHSLWNHAFLKEYTVCLIKKQWGINLLKFEGMQLPGGVTISGRQIYEDALNDMERLMQKFRDEEDVGPVFFIG
jgi:hypothetical protein